MKRYQFENYLSGLDGEHTAGIIHDAEDCPLARFIRSKRPGMFVEVFSDYYRVEYRRRPMPSWADRFVAELDALTRQRCPKRLALELLSRTKRRRRKGSAGSDGVPNNRGKDSR